MAPMIRSDTRRLIGAALRAMLADNTNRQIGLCLAPASGTELRYPYAILWPLGATTDGSWGGPDEDMFYIFQAEVVGVSHEQVADLSGRVMQTLLKREANLQFSAPLVITGPSDPPAVCGRELRSLGAIESAGEGKMRTTDEYRLWLSS